MTETWVSATRVQRLATIIAGIWIEMVVCGVRDDCLGQYPAGQWLHDFTYKIILITGVAVVVMNINPLIKIDGYYFLTEVIDIPDLKERSTAFVSGWFQNRILRLPVEGYLYLGGARRSSFSMPLPPGPTVICCSSSSSASLTTSRRIGWRSSPSSQLVRWPMPFFARACAPWATWPGGFGIRASAGASVSVRSILSWVSRCLRSCSCRSWRDREDAFYVIEPMHSATLHAAVPGRVNAVLIQEGEVVRAGQPLLRMTSATAASMGSSATAQANNATFQAFAAELHGRSIGTAAAEQSAATRSAGFAREAQSSLVIAAPVDGTVLTSNPGALLDQDVASGQTLLDLADAGSRIVRVFVPASALDRIPPVPRSLSFCRAGFLSCT